ncbi:MAG: 30S ribosomal protein S9 [Dehalococcoidia bacterium]|nr:30S ribosomal protein S9 [Chloroflexota bacterium]MCY3603111.1 30S ribosomal protein S9 [Chloroflexota bacterium]MXY35256.1 30S ribosomal protein S9 [Dehalococcoidia bacterium]MYK26981.1 30S ribosomal protein S9 [Dehalococcoidia bacterium]
MAEQYYYGTGRRKTAIARVRLYPGGGAIIVNGKPLDDVFDRDMHRDEVMLPLKRVGAEGKFSAQVKCEGGGVSGWAGAIRLGIARALVEADPALKVTLKRSPSLLTRDARVKERKKPGLKRARKAPQYTKR